MEQKSADGIQVKLDQKVFVGIATGAPKLYSTYYMIAALANLDYNNLEVHWAVTGCEEKGYDEFRQRLQQLIGAVAWSQGVTHTIHYVQLTKEERNRSYGPILKNKGVLRDIFLDGDAEYFLLLGGDNPPPRNAIRRLIAVDRGVVMGTCYQRPGQDPACGVYPLVWRNLWFTRELEKHPELDDENRDQIMQSWLSAPVLVNVCYDPKWKSRGIIYNVVGGDGCALIQRKVLERIDWSTVPLETYNSEDMYFMAQSIYYGFGTAVLTDLHIPHHHQSGLVF